MAKISQPPYHLRTNKAIDRFYLIEILQALARNNHSLQYVYHSLGGPYLSDLKLIHRFFPHIPLISVEKNQQICLRQEFHKFSSSLTLLRNDLRTYLNDFVPNDMDIFWLDYTDFDKSVLDDFAFLLTKLSSGSIVRVTFRAETDFPDSATDDSELLTIWLDFKTKFGDYVPANKTFTSLLRPEPYHLLLSGMFSVAAEKSLPSEKDNSFLPLQIAMYNDGTQMMTVTGIVLSRTCISTFTETLSQIAMTPCSFKKIVNINMPELSIKERLFLERHLPFDDGKREICDILGYRLVDGKGGNSNVTKQYCSYYKYYPYFSALNI